MLGFCDDSSESFMQVLLTVTSPLQAGDAEQDHVFTDLSSTEL